MSVSNINNYFPQGRITNDPDLDKVPQIQSKKSMADITKDFKRYQTFRANDELVYSTKDDTKPVPEKEEMVLEKILKTAGNQWDEAIQYARLLEQDSAKQSVDKIFKKHGLVSLDGLERNAAFKQLEQSYNLTVKEETFRIEIEAMGRVMNFHSFDPEKDLRFAKFKTVFTGRRMDLKMGNMDKVEVKVMYTEALKTEKAVRAANYKTGLFDFSPDAKSFIH